MHGMSGVVAHLAAGVYVVVVNFVKTPSVAACCLCF